MSSHLFVFTIYGPVEIIPSVIYNEVESEKFLSANLIKLSRSHIWKTIALIMRRYWESVRGYRFVSHAKLTPTTANHSIAWRIEPIMFYAEIK